MKTVSHLWRIAKDESGQMLVLAALFLFLLLGVMAMAVDVGYLHYEQLQLQTAADSAALAAGLELGDCNYTVCANMTTAAQHALYEDGITTSTTTSSKSQCTTPTSTSLQMIINVAPCMLASDPNKGNTHEAEVVLSERQNTLFGALLGVGSFNMTARAEAGDSYLNTPDTGGNCIYTKTLSFNSSNGKFILNNCGAYDNGNLQTDSGDSATATDFLYYGTWSPNNCNNSCVWTLGDSETQPTHTTTAQTDPLKNLTQPSKPATGDSNNCSISNQDCSGHNLTTAQENGTSPVSVPPGYYGGINVNSNITVNLSPGLYYFTSSVNVNSGSTLECTTCTGGLGVTLYFTSGSLQPNSNSTIELTAPSTGSTSNGDVANMVVWESSTNSSGMTIDANSKSYYNGVIYLPDAQLTLNSGSGSTINSASSATALDVNSMIIDSGISFVINSSGGFLGGGSGQTLGKFALAE